MSMSDPLGDMLARIRNGQRAKKPSVASPASKIRTNVLEVLVRRLRRKIDDEFPNKLIQTVRGSGYRFGD